LSSSFYSLLKTFFFVRAWAGNAYGYVGYVVSYGERGGRSSGGRAPGEEGRGRVLGGEKGERRRKRRMRTKSRRRG